MITPHGMTLVLGASVQPQRYAHLAVLRLLEHGEPVIALGNRPGQIGSVNIMLEWPEDVALDTVTLYLSPANCKVWHQRILASGARRVIFNPGTEDHAFSKALSNAGMEAIEACTLVMLATGQY